MDAVELKSLQAPLKQKYKDEPESAIITLKANGRIGEGVTCSVDTGRALPRPACIRLPAVMERHFAPATCCWRRWLRAPE